MNQRTILILALATVVIVALAAFSKLSSSSSGSAAGTGEKLFPGMLDALNDATTVEIEDADGKVTLKRVNGEWGLDEKHGYAIDFERVKTNLFNLAELETVERKTRSKDRYAALGVEGLDAEDSKSRRVKVTDSSGKALCELIVGERKVSRRGAEQVYVRKPAEDQSWLVSGRLDLDSDQSRWLEKQILEVERKRIQAIEILHADGEALRVSKASEDVPNFTVHDLPEDRELTYATVADSLSNTLEWLNLEDVAPAADVPLTGEPQSTTTFWTFDGLKLTVAIHEQDGGAWARFTAAYDAETPPFVETPETPPPAPEKVPMEVEKEAAELSEKLAPWVYELPVHSRSSLQKRMEELLKPLDTGEPEMPPDDVKLEDLLSPEQIEQINQEHGLQIGEEPDDGDEDDGDDR